MLRPATSSRIDAGSSTGDNKDRGAMTLTLWSLPRIIPCSSITANALGINAGRLASRRPNLNVTLTRNVQSSANCRPQDAHDDAVPTPHRRQAMPVGGIVGLQQTIVRYQSRQHRSFSAEAASKTAENGPLPLWGDNVIVTKRCAERINELRESKSLPGLRLRLTVEGGGCSGFQYKFALEDAIAAEASDEEGEADADSDDESDGDIDHEFERNGAILVVDETSLGFVKGATVDFEESMMRSAFAVLNNPVSESACGCGSSFAMKNFEKNPALD